MSIILRQISQRAGGGEIARTSTLDVAELIIGRGTDCDVQIPDLAVMLRHARLHRLASGRVALDAIGGVPLNVNGRFVEAATFDASDLTKVMLGSHLLTVKTGDTADDIVVTVERVAPLYDSAEAKDEARIFGLEGVMPGRRVMAWALTLLILAAFLAWPIWSISQPKPVVASTPLTVQKASFSPDQMWISGPLSTAHANLSKNCGACHDKAFVTVRDESCRTCHAKLPDHAPLAKMQASRGMPVGFIKNAQADIAHATHLTVGRCASCHKEHEGANGTMTTSANFCTDCHNKLGDRIKTTLGNVTDFAHVDGHPEFSAAVVTRPDPFNPVLTRISLAAHPKENSGLKFTHAQHLSATGSVARAAAELAPRYGFGKALTCSNCHVPDADGVRWRAVSMESNCAMCHDLSVGSDRNGVVRTLPHGEPVQVAGIIRDFVLAGGSNVVPSDRRRPGITPALFQGNANSRANMMIRSVFTGKGACVECHTVIPPSTPGGVNFGIAPVSLADHYFSKGRFPHKQHDATPCATCHVGATTSNASSDVMLPGIATCRSCHGNPKVVNVVPSTCNTCHGYHQGPEGIPPPGHNSSARKTLKVAVATVEAKARS